MARHLNEGAFEVAGSVDHAGPIPESGVGVSDQDGSGETMLWLGGTVVPPGRLQLIFCCSRVAFIGECLPAPIERAVMSRNSGSEWLPEANLGHWSSVRTRRIPEFEQALCERIAVLSSVCSRRLDEVALHALHHCLGMAVSLRVVRRRDLVLHSPLGQ